MNRLLFSLIALTSGLPFLLQAQTATSSVSRDIPPPQPPLVLTPQPGTQWTISVKYDAEASTTSSSPTPSTVAPTRRPVLLRYQCAKETTIVTVQWSDGTKLTGYVKAGQVIFQDAKTGSCYAAATQDTGPYLPLYSSEYPGIGWITLKDYQGTEAIEKEPCYRFYRAEEFSGDVPIPARTAWIRVRDKEPVRVKYGEGLYLYSSIGVDASSLAIPQEVRSFMDQVKSQQSALDLLKQMNQKQ